MPQAVRHSLTVFDEKRFGGRFDRDASGFGNCVSKPVSSLPLVYVTIEKPRTLYGKLALSGGQFWACHLRELTLRLPCRPSCDERLLQVWHANYGAVVDLTSMLVQPFHFRHWFELCHCHSLRVRMELIIHCWFGDIHVCILYKM